MNQGPQTARAAWRAAPVPCDLCGSEEHELLATRGKGDQVLHTVMCLRCALVFTNPMPTQEELLDYYRHHYREHYKHVKTPKARHVYRAGTRAVSRYRRIERLLEHGTRILDIGSGGGEFLHLLQCAGLDAHGIEPNLGYAQFSRDQYGLRVSTSPLESASFAPGAFDVVTAHHVVEHLCEPFGALQRMWGWLEPGGHAVVEVPNVEARYHSPKNRFHQAHLFHFCPETLEAMGRNAGFEVLDTTLAPATLHINTIFRKVDACAENAALPAVVERVRASLKLHTPGAHLLSAHPYRRLLSNLARPLREQMSMPRAGSARQLLDRIYGPVVDAGP